jgi:hypothetical protein
MLDRVKAARREILSGSAAVAAATLLGCRASSASAGLSIAQRRVVRTLPGMATVEGAGVRLTRIIGQPALRHLDPFVLLDRLHSDDPEAYVRGFPITLTGASRR